MHRREFLTSMAGGAMVAMVPPRASAQAAAAHVTIEYEGIGQTVPVDFIGLSYESAVVAANDYFTADNRNLLRLLRGLGSDGVLRIGGNTSERAVWRSDDVAASDNDFVITPFAIDRLAHFLRALGWKLIYGLNLATGTPAQAAREAAYVAEAVGPRLLAFQIGNEPDGFGRWSGVRPSNYDAAAYVAEWRRYHDAIRTAVPDAHFAGPDVAAATDWTVPLAEAAPSGLVMLTRHYYADGPASNPAVTLTRLLRSADQVAPVLSELATLGRTYRLPWRIAETNSVFGGGRPGVSDTLGAALWGAELMFQIAAAGGAGVNFHAGEDKVYTPISHRGSGGLTARALYYGMLLFAAACRQSGSELIPLRCDGALSAYAVRGADGALHVALINKDPRAVSARIDAGRAFVGASVLRLTAPRVDAVTNVTFGDATVDGYGAWAAASHEPASWRGTAIDIDVAGSSAVLISTGG